MNDDLERWERHWASEARRLRRFFRVRAAMLERIDSLDDWLIILLRHREDGAQKLKELLELKWGRTTKEAASDLAFLVAYYESMVEGIDLRIDAAFKELANLESSIQRRWARYTIWVSLVALALSVYATFFK